MTELITTRELKIHLSSKEQNFPRGEFYFFVNLMSFTYFLNNIKRLDGEKINRIHYYFSSLLKAIDINKIDLQIHSQQHEICFNIIEKLNFLKISKKETIEAITALFIVFHTHKEILRFYPKKTFFNKSIEYKLKCTADGLIKEFSKMSSRFKKEKLGLVSYFYILEGLINNEYYQYVLERQSHKKFKYYFNEFDSDIFDYMYDESSLINCYREFLNKEIASNSYKYGFCQEIINILEKII